MVFRIFLVCAVLLGACAESAGTGGGSGGTGGTGGIGGGAGVGGSAGSGGFGGTGGSGGGGGTTSCTPRDVPALATEPVAPGFGWHKPLFVTQAPDAPELYVLEQGDDLKPARILVVQGGNEPSTFLDLTGIVNDGFESGLLGLAFHPDYNTLSDPNNGRFFVFYTTGDPRKNVVAEYARGAGDPLVADPNEVQRLIDLDDRAQNHNGGMVTFGPDGFLYVGIGDEGAAADIFLNGQNLSTIFATILRLDVDANGTNFAAAGNPFSATTDPAGDPRIWHYGLRNPWRFSFDRESREMYIGDVGQNDWEEIDVAPADQSGLNFGWSAYEGDELFAGGSGVDDLPTPATFPIDVIPHQNDPHLGDTRSVTGGYVYRGDAISGLDGFYLFGDFERGRVAAFEYRDGETCNRQEIPELAGNGLSSFGQDNDGELYLTFFDGKVLRIVEANP
ncbi:MAG: PQQ-dependent sugar dehydrogenase [Deltaproteobacteria bacterium]|nr:PQQ-dependent sugar dehydrogenase [Deltaproteobacteria bacterium]